MKTRITFLMVALISAICVVQAQNLLVDDFEDGLKWGGYGGHEVEVVANPNSSGINTSSNVLQVSATAELGQWGGIYYDKSSSGRDLLLKIGTLEAVNEGEFRYVHFKMLRNETNRIIIKFPGDYQSKALQVVAGDDWQYIVIDLLNQESWADPMGGKEFNKFDMQPYKDMANKATFYIDDFYFSPSATPITDGPISGDIRVNDDSGIRLSRSIGGNTVAHIGDLKGQLKLEVYSITGSLMKVVYDGVAEAGAYELPSFGHGIYLLKATTSKGIYSFKF